MAPWRPCPHQRQREDGPRGPRRCLPRGGSGAGRRCRSFTQRVTPSRFPTARGRSVRRGRRGGHQGDAPGCGDRFHERRVDAAARAGGAGCRGAAGDRDDRAIRGVHKGTRGRMREAQSRGCRGAQFHYRRSAHAAPGASRGKVLRLRGDHRAASRGEGRRAVRDGDRDGKGDGGGTRQAVRKAT